MNNLIRINSNGKVVRHEIVERDCPAKLYIRGKSRCYVSSANIMARCGTCPFFKSGEMIEE